ncbi:MAG: hypothetical protein PHU23_12615 [Dehalococcoidales bacterium]|nr:hypothetical protein [Dehalococcoidales bacterium]
MDNYQLMPGTYIIEATVKNTSHYRSVAGNVPLAARLETIAESNIPSIEFDPVSHTYDYAAGETRVLPFSFNILDSMIGQNLVFTITVLDEEGNTLGSDQIGITVINPEMQIIALNLVSLNSSRLGAVPAGTPLGLQEDDDFWAVFDFDYKYKGGNYTFLAEINVNPDNPDGQWLRSFADVTLPDRLNIGTNRITTQNADPFQVGNTLFGQMLTMRITLIYRGTDGSLWQNVRTWSINSAARNDQIVPIYGAEVDVGV